MASWPYCTRTWYRFWCIVMRRGGWEVRGITYLSFYVVECSEHYRYLVEQLVSPPSPPSIILQVLDVELSGTQRGCSSRSKSQYSHLYKGILLPSHFVYSEYSRKTMKQKYPGTLLVGTVEVKQISKSTLEYLHYIYST